MMALKKIIIFLFNLLNCLRWKNKVEHFCLCSKRLDWRQFFLDRVFREKQVHQRSCNTGKNRPGNKLLGDALHSML